MCEGKYSGYKSSPYTVMYQGLRQAKGQGNTQSKPRLGAYYHRGQHHCQWFKTNWDPCLQGFGCDKLAIKRRIIYRRTNLINKGNYICRALPCVSFNFVSQGISKPTTRHQPHTPCKSSTPTTPHHCPPSVVYSPALDPTDSFWACSESTYVMFDGSSDRQEPMNPHSLVSV